MPHLAECRVGRGGTRTIRFLTAFDRTSQTVGIRALYRRSHDTARSHGSGYATRLNAIAAEAIVADGIVGREIARIRGFIATVCRARAVVVANDGASGLAADTSCTRLSPVAINSVITGRVVGDVVATVIGLVARICSARDVVIAIDGRARSAAEYLVARLGAITEQVVRA